MKTKVILLFISLLFESLALMAQNHMKFVGIPIDGNIQSFTEKLHAKGFSKSPDEATGIYSYTGIFYGENVIVDVNFDPSTKCVYQVAVNFIQQFSAGLYSIQKEIHKTIEEKYQYKKDNSNPQSGQYTYYIYEGYNPIGIIQTYVLDPHTFNRTGESMLSVTYMDFINYTNYENHKRGDI